MLSTVASLANTCCCAAVTPALVLDGGRAIGDCPCLADGRFVRDVGGEDDDAPPVGAAPGNG